MRHLLTLLFLSICFLSFGQDDHELYQQYANSATRKLNKNVICVTEYELRDDNTKVKRMETQYNTKGLPDSIVYFTPDGEREEGKIFIYDKRGYIRQIKTNDPFRFPRKDNKPDGICFFNVNSSGQINDYTVFIYSEDYVNDSSKIGQIFVEYNSNKQIRKKFRVSDGDTCVISFFDSSGRPSRTYYRNFIARMNDMIRVDYIFSDDKSEMKKISYHLDSTIHDTTIHKYLNHLEVEEIYSLYGQHYNTISKLSYFYDKNGRLKNCTYTIWYSNLSKEQPIKIYYTYEYKLRN